LLDELVEIQKDTIEIPQTSHYVDNKKFLAALIEYKAGIDAAKEKNEELPRVPRYIGECIYHTNQILLIIHLKMI